MEQIKTLCYKCEHCSNHKKGESWYDYLCTLHEREKKVDPVSGAEMYQVEYKDYLDYEKYPDCRDYNTDGNCMNYQQYKELTNGHKNNNN
jgi:hypothetical protein